MKQDANQKKRSLGQLRFFHILKKSSVLGDFPLSSRFPQGWNTPT